MDGVLVFQEIANVASRKTKIYMHLEIVDNWLTPPLRDLPSSLTPDTSL